MTYTIYCVIQDYQWGAHTIKNHKYDYVDYPEEAFRLHGEFGALKEDIFQKKLEFIHLIKKINPDKNYNFAHPLKGVSKDINLAK